MSNVSIEQKEDRPAYVRFEQRAIQNMPESAAAGHPVYKDVDYILVTPPYTKDEYVAKVETFFADKENEVTRQRIPASHLEYWKKGYAAFKEGLDMPLDGQPIMQWSAITNAQKATLRGLKIHTIEDLAQINDEGLRRIGMGAMELKRTAENWLNSSNDLGAVTAKITQLETANEALQKTNDELIERMDLLLKSFEKGDNVTSITVNEKPVDDIVSTDILAGTSNPTDSIMTPTKEYEQLFGRKPNPNWKESTLLTKIKAEKKLQT